MQWVAMAALLGGTMMLAACDGGAREMVTALDGRVAALERRAETDATGSASDAAADVVARLDADVRSLELRLAEVEADVALLRDAAVPGDRDGQAAGEARREARSERRDRMRELTATYRDRLAEVRRQYRDDPADPGRQQALRDVVEWYRSERRALMRAD